MVAERTRDYELVMVLSPEAVEEEVAAAVERVTGFITERGGGVSNHEIWGLRRLAYPIKRFQEGNYILARFSIDAAQLRELERSLTASEDVLRHLITKVDKNAKPVPADQPSPAPADEAKPAAAEEASPAPADAAKPAAAEEASVVAADEAKPAAAEEASPAAAEEASPAAADESKTAPADPVEGVEQTT